MSDFPFDREYDPKFAYEWKVFSVLGKTDDDHILVEKSWQDAGWKAVLDDGKPVEYRGTRLYRRDKKLNDQALNNLLKEAHDIRNRIEERGNEIYVKASGLAGVSVENLVIWKPSAIFYYLLARICGPKQWLIRRYLGVSRKELIEFAEICGYHPKRHLPEYIHEQTRILIENKGMRIDARGWQHRRNVVRLPAKSRWKVIERLWR